MWWHHQRHFEFTDKGNIRAREGYKQEFSQFWKQRERAAWTYELVRRLRLVLNLDGVKDCNLPPGFLTQTMEKFPAYIELTPAMQEAVTDNLNLHLGLRPITLNPELLRQNPSPLPLPPLLRDSSASDLPPQKITGYAELPSMAFDLMAGDEPLVEKFLLTINSLRIEHGIPRKRRQKHMSKNKGKRKSARWDHLDFVCDPIRYKTADCSPRRCARKLAKTALAYADVVAFGVFCVWPDEQDEINFKKKAAGLDDDQIAKTLDKLTCFPLKYSETYYPFAQHLAKYFSWSDKRLWPSARVFHDDLPWV